jgi:hypothetical protein
MADMHRREFERVVEWTIAGLEHTLDRIRPHRSG